MEIGLTCSHTAAPYWAWHCHLYWRGSLRTWTGQSHTWHRECPTILLFLRGGAQGHLSTLWPTCVSPPLPLPRTLSPVAPLQLFSCSVVSILGPINLGK